MKRRELFTLLVIGCLVVLVSFGVASAVAKGKASGIVTSIEDDGTVMIKQDENSKPFGYLLSSSVVVEDYRGRHISLRDIKLPCRVYYEFEYTQKGFKIILIKQVPA